MTRRGQPACLTCKLINSFRRQPAARTVQLSVLKLPAECVEGVTLGLGVRGVYFRGVIFIFSNENLFD